MSAGVIFREKGKIVERTVAQAKLQFFADSGTDAPAKLVLERYIGPDFESANLLFKLPSLRNRSSI